MMRAPLRIFLPFLLAAVACPVTSGCANQTDTERFDPRGTSGGSGGVDTTVSVGVGPSTSVGSGQLWSNFYGDAADQQASSFVVSAAGNSALSGSAAGVIDFGNIPWSGGVSDTDAVVAKLDRSGHSLWSRRYGDSCDQHGAAVALTPGGDVVLAGDFCGKIDFGVTELATSGGEIDAFVVVLDSLGEDVYSRRFGGEGPQIVRAAAADLDGNAIVVGTFEQAFDDGTGPVVSAGKDDVFVVKLDPAGKLLWSRRYGGPESDLVRAVAVDPTGNVVFGGSFGADVDFGGGPLKAGAGHRGAFLVVLDPEGNHLSSRSFGDPDDASVNAVAVNTTGQLIVGGYFAGTVDIEGTPIASAGGTDIFLTSLDLDGKPLWASTYGGKGAQAIERIAVAGFNGVAVAVTSDEPLDFGVPGSFGTVGTADLTDRIILASFGFNGKFGDSQGVIVSDGPTHLAGIGGDDLGSLSVVGSFKGRLEAYLLDRYEPAESKGNWDIFALQVR